MVEIIKLFITFIFFFVKYAYSSNNITIIRDAEIEFFLYQLLQDTVGNSLLKNNTYYPRLVLNDEYNAFVTGSKNIYINTGLIEQAKSLSEIQGIISHEVGHIVLNHHNSRSINIRKSNNNSKLATIAGTALSLAGKLDTKSAIGLIIGGQDLATKSFLQFNRIQEQQADRFALETMKKNKISFQGLERLLLKLSNEELLTKTSLTSYYKSHPFSKNRLNQLRKYKSKVTEVLLEKKDVNINNNKISLGYIKNKIKAYNKDPYEILKREFSNDVLLSNYSRTIAYLKIGKYDLANNHLKKLQSEYKNYPFFFELAGDIYYQNGDFNEAIKEYIKAIKYIDKNYRPANELLKFSLVKSYIQTNKIIHLNKCIRILEELLQNNPNWSYLWRLLAKSSGKINKKGISFIALAEESLLKKNFIKAKKYVDLALIQQSIPSAYKLRGADILARIKLRKP